ncbi:hypothetical protein QYM36_012798 [Artemia franciscana]|uniref:Uncharacterized protein n=1 Tax=Artemia franciscana TaxID=6661 RepID=A0AA88KY30_ARTSF|nr:hypothetical protein QYM36_012798 [Artemia franciscana]
MLLRIQPYDLIIAFHPGKEISVADALSALRTLPPAPSTSRPAQEEPQNSPYITRSGRLLKPIQRLDM